MMSREEMKEEERNGLDVVGQVIGGSVAGIAIREKIGKNIEFGDLLVAKENEGGYLIL